MKNGRRSVFRYDEIVHFALTDVGVKRSHNQDSFGASTARSEEGWQTRGHLYLVADGMGSHAVGELASKIAVDTIQHAFAKIRDQDVEAALRDAIVEANHTIHERGQQNPEFRGMGTTATCLSLRSDGARVGHVGDSRCYRIRGAQIEQLSFDHSLLWELARRQNKRPEELESVPSNIIIRSLGPDAQVKVDVNGPYPIKPGDRFLLCSDGLTGPVSDKELWAVVTHLSGEEACRFLVDLANLRGGLDNITVLLVQVGDTNGPAEERTRTNWKAAAIDLARRTPPFGWLFLASAMLLAFAFLLSWLGAGGGRLTGSIGWLVLIVGLGFLFRRIRTMRLEKELPPPPPPPIYRSTTCVLEPQMIERLSRIETTLREAATIDGWTVDWDRFRQRRESADRSSLEGDLPTAFGEYCRAVSVLAEGWSKHRQKNGGFKPRFKD